MELDRFAEIVDDMIVQLDYPGFEPRGLRLGLPEELQRMHAKVFTSALGHKSVYVRLAALRWFQERPGIAKSNLAAISGLLDNSDEFIRVESVKTIEQLSDVEPAVLTKVAALLKDQYVDVRKATAKALGKLAKRSKRKNEDVLRALTEASHDSDPEVRMKVEKAIRQVNQ